MSEHPPQQSSGSKATCQTASSPPESTPPYPTHYQLPMEYLKVQLSHPYYFVFIWTICPPYLVTPALNRKLITRKSSFSFHYVR